MQLDSLKPAQDAKNGVWIDFDAEKGVAFLLAFSGTTKYEEKHRRLSFRARRRSHNRALPPELQTEVTVDALLGDILLGWHGLDDGFDDAGKDKPLEFTPKNAKRILTDYPEIRNFIIVESSALSNFRPEEEGATEGGEKAATASDDTKSEITLVS